MKIRIIGVALAFLPGACHSTSTTPPLSEGQDGGAAGSPMHTGNDAGGEAGRPPGGSGGDDGEDGGGSGGSSGNGGSGTGGANVGSGGATSGSGGSTTNTGSGGGSSGSVGSASGGATSTTSGGGSSGSGGTGGTSSFCQPIAVIDDMEDGNAAICPNDGRRGGWFVVKSASAGATTPAPDSNFTAYSLVNDPRGDSLFGMRFAGTGFDNVNSADNWAYMGVSVANEAVFDASAYAGIRFWAKSNAGALRLRVQLSTTATRSDVSGGTCTGNGCDDHWGTFVDLSSSWAQYSINFDLISQVGWGQAIVKDLEHLWQVEFKYTSHPDGVVTNPSAFNILLDDVEFWN